MNDEVFELMKKQGQFPYERFGSIEKLNLPISELKREHFDNELTLSN
jgi:hypothetical protein